MLIALLSSIALGGKIGALERQAAWDGMAWGSPPGREMVLDHADSTAWQSYRRDEGARPVSGVEDHQFRYFYDGDRGFQKVEFHVANEATTTSLLSSITDKFGPPTTSAGTYKAWRSPHMELRVASGGVVTVSHLTPDTLGNIDLYSDLPPPGRGWFAETADYKGTVETASVAWQATVTRCGSLAQNVRLTRVFTDTAKAEPYAWMVRYATAADATLSASRFADVMRRTLATAGWLEASRADAPAISTFPHGSVYTFTKDENTRTLQVGCGPGEPGITACTVELSTQNEVPCTSGL